MSIYLCDFCKRLRDSDYCVCHETPKEQPQLKVTGLICDDCNSQYEEDFKRLMNAKIQSDIKKGVI